jgi:hypothetical protein
MRASVRHVISFRPHTSAERPVLVGVGRVLCLSTSSPRAKHQQADDRSAPGGRPNASLVMRGRGARTVEALELGG